MSGVNKVILVGNLRRDPGNVILMVNISVAKFPLATSEVYKNKDGKELHKTEWHNVVLATACRDWQKILKKAV